MDFGSLAIGMVLGVVVGMLPIPLGDGRTIRLGVAGGSLLVALVLGRVERTGGISWLMPVPANLTMRQIGLLLFLAGLGIRAGYSFADSLHHNGLQLLLAGAVVTFVTLATLVIDGTLGMRSARPAGLASSVQTQPACLVRRGVRPLRRAERRLCCGLSHRDDGEDPRRPIAADVKR
jgi:putative transport protein